MACRTELAGEDVNEKEVDVDLGGEERELDEGLRVYWNRRTRYGGIEKAVNDAEGIFELGETARLDSEVSGEREPSPVQF